MDNKKFQSNKDREKFLDEKFEEIQEAQEADLLLDFDKAVEEAKEKPYKIKFLGNYYDIPRQMPFNFATFFFRNCYKKVKGNITVEVPDEKLYLFIQLMFGNEFLRALENNRKRISIDVVFEKLAVTILNKWGYGVNSTKNKMQEKKL